MFKRILALVLMASMVMVQVPVGVPAFGSSTNMVSSVVKVTPADTLTETTAPVLIIEEKSPREFNGAPQEFRLNIANGEWIPDICAKLSALVPALQGATGDIQFERRSATELSITIPQLDNKGTERQALRIPLLTTAFSKIAGDVFVTIDPRDTKVSGSTVVFALNSGSLEAKLESLTVDKGTLSPAFSRSVYAYTVDVANDVESIGLCAVPIIEAATIRVNNTAYKAGDIYTTPLQPGENIVFFSVAGTQGETASYMVTVKRQSDGVLKSLTVSSGMLYPTFRHNVQSYNVLVGNATETILLQAEAVDSTATVTVNEKLCQAGIGVSQALSVGRNDIQIKVVAASGMENSYSLTVFREAAESRFRTTISSIREVDLKRDIVLDTICLDEITAGSYKSLASPQFTVTLPKGYHWTSIPEFSFGSSFVGMTARASINERVLTVIPDYSHASDIGKGSIFIKNAEIATDKWNAVSDVNLTFTGGGFNNEVLLAGIYRGCYLSRWEIYADSITPAFDPYTYQYSGTIGGGNRSIGMDIFLEEGATVLVNGISPSGYTRVPLVYGDNPIAVEVTGPKGATKTYSAVIKRWGTYVGSTTLKENEEITALDAPVLTVCENNSGDYTNPQTFRLMLTNAQWGTNAVVQLESAAPDVKTDRLSYEMGFKQISDTVMDVTLSNVVNKTNLPLLVRIPLPAKVATGEAKITVDPRDTRFMGLTAPFANTEYAYMINVTTEGAVNFNSAGVAALKPIVIEETEADALLIGRRLIFEVPEENCVFDCTAAEITVSAYGGLARWNGKFTPVAYDKNKFEVYLDQTAGSVQHSSGKLVISGLKLKRTADPTIANYHLLFYGSAMRQYSVGVATENTPTLPPVVTPPPTTGTTTSGGGGGGGGGSGTFTISAANETEIQQNGLYLKFSAQSYRSDFSFKTAMFSFDKPPVSEGQTLISDIWNMGMTQTGDLQKPYFIRMGYSPSKVDKSREKLALCWLDEQKNEWIPVEDVKVDYDFGNVTGSTQRQGKFALVATSLKGKTATLQPEAIPLSTPKTILKDIQGHWAEAAINKLVGKSAVSGNPDGTFQPEKQVTRGEFITMLVKALELKGTTEKSFSDLNGHWAAEAIKAAYGSGILTGYEDGTIRPDALITREQMALMITKAAKIPAGVPEKHPTDEALIAPWAKDAVLSAIKAGTISGYADNTFRPQALATKAEAVAIIARCMK